MKRILSAILVLLFVPWTLCICAHAEESVPDFEGMTWDECVQRFFDEYGIDTENVAVGYYNTVTGEEHYIDPDTYRVAGSLYKLPLNMYFADLIDAGQMEWDSEVCGSPYSRLMEMSIVYSDNDISEMLQEAIGGYVSYRTAISPYMGVDTSKDTDFQRSNHFTARQMTFCLRTLYNGMDRYRPIVDAMERAAPGEFFLSHENRFEVAHKYGYFEDSESLYTNDSAIVFTTQPVLLVLMTRGESNVGGWMGAFCVLMSEYAEYHALNDNEPDVPEIPEVIPEPAPVSPEVSETVPETAVGTKPAYLWLMIPAALVAAAAVFLIIRRRRR